MPWLLRFILQIGGRSGTYSYGEEDIFQGNLVSGGKFMILSDLETNSMHLQVPRKYEKVKVQGHKLEVNEVVWDYEEGIVRVYMIYDPPRKNYQNQNRTNLNNGYALV